MDFNFAVYTRTWQKLKQTLLHGRKWAIQTIFPERMTVFYVTHFGQSTHITNYAYIKICKCRYLRKLHSLRLHEKVKLQNKHVKKN